MTLSLEVTDEIEAYLCVLGAQHNLTSSEYAAQLLADVLRDCHDTPEFERRKDEARKLAAIIIEQLQTEYELEHSIRKLDE